MAGLRILSAAPRERTTRIILSPSWRRVPRLNYLKRNEAWTARGCSDLLLRLGLGLYLGPAPVLRIGDLLARFGAQDSLLSGVGFGGRFLRGASGFGGCGSERGQQSACLLQPGYLGVDLGKNVFNRHGLRIMHELRP